MDNWFKWLVSVVCGAVATFYQQYGLLIVFVCLAIVFDCVTGLIKAKTIKSKGLERLLEENCLACRSVLRHLP